MSDFMLAECYTEHLYARSETLKQLCNVQVTHNHALDANVSDIL